MLEFLKKIVFSSARKMATKNHSPANGKNFIKKKVALQARNKYLNETLQQVINNHWQRLLYTKAAVNNDVIESRLVVNTKNLIFFPHKNYDFYHPNFLSTNAFKKSIKNISVVQRLNFFFKNENSTSALALLTERMLEQSIMPSKLASLGPELPVLNELIRFAKQDLPFKPDFKDVIFVCGQHLLSTTISLFETLVKLGANPKNIFVVGKNYSNNEEVIMRLKELGVHVQLNSQQLTLGGFNATYNADIAAMWESCYSLMHLKKGKGENITGVIVLDDGGHVSANMPAKVKYFTDSANDKDSTINVVCIEQTSSGMNSTKLLPVPTIEVATAALKQWIEPPLVARKCVEEIRHSLKRVQAQHTDVVISQQPTFGIVGLGKIGSAILEELIEAGYQNFIIFDKNEDKVKLVQKSLGHHKSITLENVDLLWALFNNSDVIIGCTGYDITGNKGLDIFKTIKSPKMLISCSSKDTEFKTVLEHIQERYKKTNKKPCQPLDDIYYKNGFRAPIILVRGGTPIGFTNGMDSVEPRGIEPIRGLKTLACLQAYHMLINGHQEAESYMVNPDWQAFLIAKWLESKPPVPYPANLADKGKNLNEIEAHSGGALYDIGMKQIKSEDYQSTITFKKF